MLIAQKLDAPLAHFYTIAINDRAAYYQLGEKLRKMKPQQRRKRGVILSSGGWKKLQTARTTAESQENWGERYTLEQLSDRTGLDISTVARVLEREKAVDRRTLERFFQAFHLELSASDYSKPNSNSQYLESSSHPRADLSEAVDVSFFYGRDAELTQLDRWIFQDRCRLIALLGMGGIGKTALSVKLAHQIKHEFEYIIWRSLRHAPPLQEILTQLIQFFSHEQVTATDIPDNLNNRISQLVKYLQNHRCLLILDRLEAILQSGDAGYYRQGYEGYAELIRCIGEIPHQSCLVLTSREKPEALAVLAGETLPIRYLQLTGINPKEAQEIFKTKGLFINVEEAKQFVERYTGNPLVLKIVATAIQELFHDNISEFLAQKITIFSGISQLLDWHFYRLSPLEQQVLYWLAIEREPVSITQLQNNFILAVAKEQLLKSLESLNRRCLIEKCKNTISTFTLQPLVMEYAIEQLVAQICVEIATAKIHLLNSHALIKAQAKEWIEKIQSRILLKSVINKLLTVFDSKTQIEAQLRKILIDLRMRSPRKPGFAAGNILHLLLQMETNLSGYDFSDLCVWQVNLQTEILQNVNFTNTDFTKSIFTETFGGVLSVALSPNGKLIATGDTNAEICLWQEDGRKMAICQGHTGWIRSVAFSQDGKILASGSSDGTIKLWDVQTGECLKTLQEHNNRIRVVTFSPQGHILASGSDDFIIKLWDIRSGQCLKTWQRQKNLWSLAFHPQGNILASGSDDKNIILWDVNTGKPWKILRSPQGQIRTVTFSPQGHILATAGEDALVRLWDVSSGKCINVLQGHQAGVWSVAFSPIPPGLCEDGEILASASRDRAIKLWDTKTGQTLKTLQGHASWIWSVAFAANGHLVSGGADRTVKLWDVGNGQCMRTLHGYSNGVWAVAFSPTDRNQIASVSDDLMVRLWDVSTGQTLQTFRGHSNGVWSVAFSQDGQMLASSSDDQTVRLWNVSTGQAWRILSGHTSGVWSVAFHPQAKIVASGGADRTIRLWDVNTGEAIAILIGHTSIVRAVTFSPDGTILASGGRDLTIRLWDTSSGQILAILEGYTKPISSISFSPDGKILASGSDDGTAKLWDLSTGKCIQTLQGHTDWIQSVALSPIPSVLPKSNLGTMGGILASGSHDRTVKLWDVNSGKSIKTLQGHTGWIWSVAFSRDGTTLASSSQDGTIKVWDLLTGECSKTLTSARPYEGMNITGTTGLTVTQKATLKALGAVELEDAIDSKIIPISRKTKGRSAG